MPNAARTIFRMLASLKLAVVLIVGLAAVLAWATFLEAAKGRECALWHVYHSVRFAALLAILAINLLAAALIRFPWKTRQIGFLLAHAGLLVLLAGALVTFFCGIEGQLTFREGETANTLLLTDRSQFTVLRQTAHDGHGQLPGAFIFRPGPSNWAEGKSLDLGEFGGVSLKVLKFYRHARMEETWVNDESGHGAAALRLSVAGTEDQEVADQWLVADQFGSPSVLGGVSLELQQAAADTMRDDFLRPPPPAVMDRSGVLSMHYEGKVYRVPVSENLGKKVPVGESGIAVEIVEYLPAAKPGETGRFVSTGDEPTNPLLELRVHLPGSDKSIRQIAFARRPLLNLDGVHGWSCPVKFWYHHPAVEAEPGAEFLQTPDGQLYCRLGRDGKHEVHGPVHKDDQFEIAPQLKVSVLEHLPNARREVHFDPVETAPGDGGSEAAALVEVAAGDTTRQVWLRRNDPEYGRQLISLPQSMLGVMFGYERLPLPFSLQLVSFRQGLNPGRMGAASFTSSVKLIDEARGVDEVREISMNQPLVHSKFTFYQSSFNEMPGEKAMSVLSVSYDPGRLLKYSGSVMICLGILLMYAMRSPLLRRRK